jgi:hypothetical protein
LIRQILSTAFLSLGVGFLCQLVQDWLGSQYFNEFLRANLINLLVALLAVNSATMGIVLTKIRDLVDSQGHGEVFKETRQHMLLSVKEQIGLIALAVALLTVSQSKHLAGIPNLGMLLNSSVAAVFIYGMLVLYDTAKSVLIIIDYNPENNS